MSSSKSTSLTTVPEDHAFINPVKLIKTMDDMQKWDSSEAYHEYVAFICTINDAIRGINNSKGAKESSDHTVKLCELLRILNKWIDETPPIQQPQRFGNAAFKTWYNKLKDEIIGLLQVILPKDMHRAIPEIMVYFLEGFGNPIRIDYGTGHEMSFLMFLCALYKIGYLKISDFVATGCYVFPRYLVLIRKLQQTYRMEPAGSHGVWSLDDFNFVPFIWGSSQLTGHPDLHPISILNNSTTNSYAAEYIFFGCIKYINQVKYGPFAEHSNQLWNLTSLNSWSQINSGLIKMYKAEILAKFPVVQHVLFGSLYTLKPVETGATTRHPIPLDDGVFRKPCVPPAADKKEQPTSTTPDPDDPAEDW